MRVPLPPPVPATAAIVRAVEPPVGQVGRPGLDPSHGFSTVAPWHGPSVYEPSELVRSAWGTAWRTRILLRPAGRGRTVGRGSAVRLGDIANEDAAAYGKPLDGVRVLAPEQMQALPYATQLLPASAPTS